jgi:aspartate/methionine/tyrosine aminotransferase
MSDWFSDSKVNLAGLKKKAFNYRWATVEEGVIPLTAADPDFPVAEPIVKAIVEYSADGYFSYGPPQGLIEFREAIAAYYQRNYDVHANATCILPVNSAAFGLFVVAQYLLKPGDNAIIPNPVDFLFRKSIEHAGAQVRTTCLDKSTSHFDLNEVENLIDENTKAIFICNPNNPLGKTSSKEALEALIRLAQKHDLWIVSDEIWADIDYNKQVTSIADMSLPKYEKRFIVSGLSKNYALAGLRIGYIICPNEVTFTEILNASGHLTTAFGLSGIAQAAGTAALNDCGEWQQAFLMHLGKMRLKTIDFIGEMGIFHPLDPDVTYLAFPAFSDESIISAEWVEKVLAEAKVALVPGGTNWFESASEGHVRICYATSAKILEEAFERILTNKHKLI